MISIVTPAYNAARTLRRTLESVERQRGDFEHLVYDGGSTDGSQDIVRQYASRYPVRLIEGPNLGVYGNVANAFREARGQILGWINADDFYMPWTLSTVRRVFTVHPEVHWVSGIPGWYYEDEDLSETMSFAPVYFQELIARGWQRRDRLGWLQQESQFWRRSLYELAGGDAVLRSYRYAADYHLWRTFAGHAPLRTIGAMLACFTVRSGQFSAANADAYLAEAGVQGRNFWMGRLGWQLAKLASMIFARRVLRAYGFATTRHPLS